MPRKLLVCINQRYGIDSPSCAGRGSEKLMETLKSEVARRGLALVVEPVRCLGQCRNGPAMRFAPGGDFLLGMSEDKFDLVFETLEKEAETASETPPDPLRFLADSPEN